ncbi:MAG: hypothetical protein GXY79_03350 [Chloroflexi bacterium]|nr:hypothetical protein [Chloroflexota bacterium]
MQIRKASLECLRANPWLPLALVAALLIGMLLAWQVLPVKVVDTDPSDLRAEHQADYVTLVADSWTVNGNSDLARERLYELVDDDTTWADVDQMLVDAIARLEAEGNPPAALRITRMRDAVPLPLDDAEQAEGQRPTRRTSATRTAVANEKPSGAGSSSPTAFPTLSAAGRQPAEDEERLGGFSLGWLPIAGLVLVLAAVAAIGAVVWREKRASRTPLPGDEPTDSDQPSLAKRRQGSAMSLNPIPAPGGYDEPSDYGANLDLQGDEYGDEMDELDEGLYDEAPLRQQPSLAPEEGWHVEEPALPESIAREWAEDSPASYVEDSSSPNWRRRGPALQSSLAAGELGVFETSYAFGDDDFYHAFTIESPTHEFLCQCGIVISDTAGTQGAQLVNAFDIWLFETQGTRTLSKVLVSDHTYHDEAVSARLARKGELVVAQPGMVIELETESIRLTATIEDLAYRTNVQVTQNVFDRLKVRMVVEQLS